MVRLTGEALRTGESVLAYFSTFEAVFMTLFWHELLMKINDVSLKLQQKVVTLSNEVSLLVGLGERVRELKQEWQMICRRAGEIANDLEINADLDSASIRMHRRLNERFVAIRSIEQRFNVPWRFGSVGVSEIEQAMASHYGQDGINARELATELQVAQEGIDGEEISVDGSTCPLRLLNVLKRDGLCGAFSQLTLLLRLYLSIPVGVASAERAFSRMSFIKNKFRSTTSQERLNGLSLIAIENDVANSLSYGDLLRD
ncbi:hypothetical protein FOZ60_015943 [Perkinsus olseni]|uniref:HAT C-terminal dimerisation domain-containing protein n=1 Tax=Perkinsus olseni TaxID=32597 RepID=A0A7J6N509_PEROL|nr:hypothetical protein FOZ60_015943 [Perkinsus olseni]